MTRLKTFLSATARRIPQIRSLYENNEDLRRRIQESIRLQEQLKNSLEEQQKQYAQLTDSSERQIENAHAEKEHLQQINSTLQSQLHEYEQINSTLQTQLHEYEQILAKRSQELTELSSQIEAYQSVSIENRAVSVENRNLLSLIQREYSTFAENMNAELRHIKTHLAGISSLELSAQHLYRTAQARTLATGEASRSADSSYGVGQWLDLMEAVLTGTVLQDESMDPWSNDTYDLGKRLTGRDWPKYALTMIGTARMRSLRALCERALADNVPGDFLEAGVWRGGACIYMKAILDAFGESSRRIFVADSFVGLPPPNQSLYPADLDDPHHKYDELQVSREVVEANFRRFGLLDSSVVFLEGWFKDTLPDAPIKQLAVLRLDGDMYESTIQTLEALYHKVSPGGYVIVDDYILKPCAKAVDDFRLANKITTTLTEVDGAAVWWQIPS